MSSAVLNKTFKCRRMDENIGFLFLKPKKNVNYAASYTISYEDVHVIHIQNQTFKFINI